MSPAAYTGQTGVTVGVLRNDAGLDLSGSTPESTQVYRCPRESGRVSESRNSGWHPSPSRTPPVPSRPRPPTSCAGSLLPASHLKVGDSATGEFWRARVHVVAPPADQRRDPWPGGPEVRGEAHGSAWTPPDSCPRTKRAAPSPGPPRQSRKNRSIGLRARARLRFPCRGTIQATGTPGKGWSEIRSNPPSLVEFSTGEDVVRLVHPFHYEHLPIEQERGRVVLASCRHGVRDGTDTPTRRPHTSQSTHSPNLRPSTGNSEPHRHRSLSFKKRKDPEGRMPPRACAASRTSAIGVRCLWCCASMAHRGHHIPAITLPTSGSRSYGNCLPWSRRQTG